MYSCGPPGPVGECMMMSMSWPVVGATQGCGGTTPFRYKVYITSVKGIILQRATLDIALEVNIG